ncbi:MAG: GNAT family N-acetyltransferase [Enterococcus sp.]
MTGLQALGMEHNLYIRKSQSTDLLAILAIINEAKLYLAQQGSSQWQNGYPNQATIQHDITLQHSYVLVVNHEIAATFVLQETPDANYSQIYAGAWQRADEAYTTIHRIAISAKFRQQNLASHMIHFSIQQSRNLGFNQLRVDTHEKNRPMQHLLTKNGFTKVGKVKVLDPLDNERLAFQKLL